MPVEITLSADEWQSILEELEELDEIRAFDEAAAAGDEEIPFEQVGAEFEAKQG